MRVHPRTSRYDDVDLKDIKQHPVLQEPIWRTCSMRRLFAARRNLKSITMSEIKEANYKVVMDSEKKSRVISDKERSLRRTMKLATPLPCVRFNNCESDRVHYPVGPRGGFTSFKPDEDRQYTTKAQLIEQIIVSLGGRAAEDLMLGEISTGAASDLKHANEIARKMITKYGMSDELSNLVFGDENDEVFLGKSYAHTRNYSEEISAKIDIEIKKIIDDAYAVGRSSPRIKINLKMSQALLDKERLEADEFEEIFKTDIIRRHRSIKRRNQERSKLSALLYLPLLSPTCGHLPLFISPCHPERSEGSLHSNRGIPRQA